MARRSQGKATPAGKANPKPGSRTFAQPRAKDAHGRFVKDTGLDARLAAANKLSHAPFVDAARLSQSDEAVIAPDFSQVKAVKKRLFLQALSRTNRIDFSAKAAGVCTATTWHWRKDHTDPVFQEALEQAVKLGVERWESELARRGFEGVKKPVYQGGRLVGTLQEYDTTAAIFMLKGALPEKYRERIDHEMSGKGGGPIQSETFTGLTVDEVDSRLQKLAGFIRGETVLPVLDVAPALAKSEAEREAEAVAEAYARALQARNGGAKGNGHG